MSQFAMDNVPAAPESWPPPLPPQPLAAKWPKAIGLVSLLLGIAQLLASLTQAVSVGLMYYQNMSNSFSIIAYMSSSFASVVTGIICGVLLVIAAILLLRHRPLARAMHYAYAIAALFSGLVVIAVQFATMFGSGGLFSIAGVGFARLLQAYPIFCLIWFSRADVRLDIQEMGEPPTET